MTIAVAWYELFPYFILRKCLNSFLDLELSVITILKIKSFFIPWPKAIFFLSYFTFLLYLLILFTQNSQLKMCYNSLNFIFF